MSTFTTINPQTGDTIKQFDLMTDEQAAAAVGRAADAYTKWSALAVTDRARHLQRIADLHRERKTELAQIMAREMGKPVTQAEGEIELSASIYEYYATDGPALLADEELEVSGGRAVLRTSATGTILGIMPWNFPAYQVARFVAPNLILGNTVLLKHARVCTETSIALEAIVRDAEVPDGAYENLILSSGQIAAIIADDRVHGVSLTGSEDAGRSVASQAGQYLKKCVLELGGSDPFIVLPDADLDSALGFAETGRFNNAGQSCTSSKRIIVHTDIWDEFLEGFVERAKAWVAGDPLDGSTKLGPMASEGGRQEIVEQVDDALAKGAELHLGGAALEGPGAYYPATVISGVTKDMRAFSEELFGPVAVLYRVESVEEAIELANDSRFGLSSAVFTQDASVADSVAEQLEVGMVGLNMLVRSQANLPFGGVKASGIGRELGRLGLGEFSNKKLLRIA